MRAGSRPISGAAGRRHPAFAALANVRHHGLICHYDRYLRRFSRAGYDIGLAPLPDDAFYRSKTNNKFREYGASGIAGIYSHVNVYSDCVRHEVTGLLAANDADSWHDALVRLIEDETLRTRIQRQARQYVREHYAQEKFEQLFLEQIQAVLGTTAAARRGRSGPVLRAGRSAMLGFFRRLVGPLRRSLDVWRRLGPRRTWTAHLLVRQQPLLRRPAAMAASAVAAGCGVPSCSGIETSSEFIGFAAPRLRSVSEEMTKNAAFSPVPAHFLRTLQGGTKRGKRCRIRCSSGRSGLWPR